MQAMSCDARKVGLYEINDDDEESYRPNYGKNSRMEGKKIKGRTIGLVMLLDWMTNVQYVYCVMRKCIMVKVWGKRTSQKACTKHRNFTKSGGNLAK